MMWRLPFGGSGSWPPVTSGEFVEYPALGSRFDDLQRELLPAFEQRDAGALAAQQTYRRFQLGLIIGATLTSFFGAVQAALGADVRWAAAVVAVLGAATTFTSAQLRREKLPQRYLLERAKAEELRSLYFDYLSGIALDGVRELESRVADIEFPKAAADEAFGATNDPRSGDDESRGSERTDFLRAYDTHRVRDQIEYYRGRIDEYGRSATQLSRLNTLFLAAAAVCGGIGAIYTDQNQWLGLLAAGLSAVAAALGGLRRLRPRRPDEATPPSDQEIEQYMIDVEAILLGEIRSWAEKWSNEGAPPAPPE